MFTLGTVLCAHTFLNWEDQRVAASLRPAGDTVSSGPVWVLHSDTQVCLLFLLLLLLLLSSSSYFWISVQEQGLWEGSGRPPLW